MRNQNKSKKIPKIGLRLGDKVKIIAGSEKGLLGVITVLNKEKQSLVIDSVKKREKAIKKNEKNQDSANPLLVKEIHISNVMLWDDSQQKASRFGFTLIEGNKARVFKKSGTQVPVSRTTSLSDTNKKE